MAFSPETYILLQNAINSVDSKVSDQEDMIEALDDKIDSVDEKFASTFTKTNYTASASILEKLEEIFTNAANNSFISTPYYNNNNLYGIIGFKKATGANHKFIFILGGSGGQSIGIANRDSEGNWSFYEIGV